MKRNKYILNHTVANDNLYNNVSATQKILFADSSSICISWNRCAAINSEVIVRSCSFSLLFNNVFPKCVRKQILEWFRRILRKNAAILKTDFCKSFDQPLTQLSALPTNYNSVIKSNSRKILSQYLPGKGFERLNWIYGSGKT